MSEAKKPRKQLWVMVSACPVCRAPIYEHITSLFTYPVVRRTCEAPCLYSVKDISVRLRAPAVTP